MKKQSALNVGILALICLLNLTLQGCCHFQGKSCKKEPTLVGSWKIRSPEGVNQSILTFREDQTFEVDIGADDLVDIHGTYEAFGNRLKFTDSPSSTCLHSGFYEYRLTERTLDLDLFADECVDRKEILKLGWRSIPMVPKE